MHCFYRVQLTVVVVSSVSQLKYNKRIVTVALAYFMIIFNPDAALTGVR